MLVSKKTMTLLVLVAIGFFAYRYFMKKNGNGMMNGTATNGASA
tara:strand:- start:9370 stop:9501 length:132 start_codon:yes stop_codon:yes gene_type:complete